MKITAIQSAGLRGATPQGGWANEIKQDDYIHTLIAVYTDDKIGWGPFGRHSHATDESIVKAARTAVGPNSLLMVDAGTSDAFWQQGYEWGMRAAQVLAEYDVYWFEEPIAPDNLSNYVLLRRNAPLPIAGGEVLTRRQSFVPWIQGHQPQKQNMLHSAMLAADQGHSIYLAFEDRSLSERTRSYLALADQELARVSQITSQSLRFYKQAS